MSESDTKAIEHCMPKPTLRTRLSRLWRNTILRFTLILLGFYAVCLTSLLGSIYWGTAGYMSRQYAETVLSETQSLIEQYQQHGLSSLVIGIHRRTDNKYNLSMFYLLVDANGNKIAGNLDTWSNTPTDENGWVEFPVKELLPDGRVEEYKGYAQVVKFRDGMQLIVGRDIRELQKIRSLIIESSTWGFLFVLLAGAVGILFLSLKIESRLEDINRTCSRIMEGDLSQRMPVHGQGDEFDHLAENLNRMLGRIEVLMDDIRQTTNNVAHDLRTPLTRLRNKLEFLQDEVALDANAHEIAREVIADTDLILSTFNAIMRIARIQSQNRTAGFEKVDLGSLGADVVELYEPVATESNQTITSYLDQPVWIEGDPHLLFQALTNLVDNAIKYTPSGGEIRVEVVKTGANATICVKDNGPGIPAELQEKVFERFFRVDSSRSSPGSGLGLSLVSAIAQLHQAELTLGDNQPGLIVKMVFKRIVSNEDEPQSEAVVEQAKRRSKFPKFHLKSTKE